MADIKLETRLAKWGHSQATRIPSAVIKELDLTDNQELRVSIQDNSIVLTPIKQKPTNIHELFANWQDDGIREQELGWGKRQGKELPW